MNERIRELAKKAKLEHCVSHVRLDDFSNLIIEEVIRYFNEEYQRNFSSLWREDLSKAIKEHFGVK